MPKGSQGQKRKTEPSDQFHTQFVDWAKGEIGDAAERFQYKSAKGLPGEIDRPDFLSQSRHRSYRIVPRRRVHRGFRTRPP